jgi:hypothetical protein
MTDHFLYKIWNLEAMERAILTIGCLSLQNSYSKDFIPAEVLYYYLIIFKFVKNKIF